MALHAPSGPWIYLVPLLAVVMIVVRNTGARRLKVERLWIAPLMVLIATALVLAAQSPPGPAMLGVEAAALALGALAGWWRGRLTHLAVDPASHTLTSRTSPLGMLLILGIFAARYALRSFGAGAFGRLHVSAVQTADALMLLAVGLVCAQRLEIALRAVRLLRETRAPRS